MNFIKVGKIHLNLDLVIVAEEKVSRGGTPILSVGLSNGNAHNFEGEDIQTVLNAMYPPKRQTTVV